MQRIIMDENTLKQLQRGAPLPPHPIQRTLKAALDRSSAFLVLVLCLPIFLVCAVLIKLTSPGPVFFIQERLGYKGVTFLIYKFRTMVDRAWEQGTGLYVTAGDPRITWIGRILRVLHIDELPQLINVVKGEMSFIGPRPTIPWQYDYYEAWEKLRLDVLPGMTGWAQVHGGNEIDWDERIKLDVWYVQHWSLWLDCRIAVQTVVHILERFCGKQDAYSQHGPGWKRGRPDTIHLTDEGAHS